MKRFAWMLGPGETVELVVELARKSTALDWLRTWLTGESRGPMTMVVTSGGRLWVVETTPRSERVLVSTELPMVRVEAIVPDRPTQTLDVLVRAHRRAFIVQGADPALLSILARLGAWTGTRSAVFSEDTRRLLAVAG